MKKSRIVRGLHAALAVIVAGTALLAAGCASSPGGLRTVTLRVGNRMYPDFADTVRVRPGESFAIGDTDFTARVDRYIPDFVIDNKTITTRSNEPNNPAVHVQVLKGDKVVEESWAFGTKGPPHISADKFMYFVIQEIELKESSRHAAQADAVSSERR